MTDGARMTARDRQAVTRVDGRRKSRAAPATRARSRCPDLAYAAIVGATIASGRITAIDTAAARATPTGVAAVLTHDNLPKVPGEPHLLPSLVGGPAPGQSFFPLQDDVVHYDGQPVAIVVADSLRAGATRGLARRRQLRRDAVDHDDRPRPRAGATSQRGSSAA